MSRNGTLESEEVDRAIAIAVYAIKTAEGQSLAVLAEAMAILGAYCAAQFRGMGEEQPVAKMHGLLREIGRHAEAHFDADLIVRAN